ncbi:hypothetical protein [Enterobacter asburiae]|uniref:hypothetical protein n=1 Tax=Enterobacter asburiae TaxID=61645 RepID=UPI003F54FE3E
MTIIGNLKHVPVLEVKEEVDGLIYYTREHFTEWDEVDLFDFLIFGDFVIKSLIKVKLRLKRQTCDNDYFEAVTVSIRELWSLLIDAEHYVKIMSLDATINEVKSKASSFRCFSFIGVVLITTCSIIWFG